MGAAAEKRPARKKRAQLDGSLLTLAREKLKSSGLTLEDGDRLGIEPLDAVQTAALHASFNAVPSLKINYYDLDGRPLTSWPKHPPFYRVRYLDAPNDFAKATEGKAMRYAQEPDSGVCCYFPRGTVVDWPTVATDPTQSLLITEGELKAAKACVEGFPCIGLGGVYNFKSSKRGVLFLPELTRIDWVRRNVYIAYDSDANRNPNVCAALNELAEELMERGAYPYMVALPDVVEGGKTGLDDFLVHESRERLLAAIEDAQPLTLADSLWRLNDRVVYVRDPGLVIECKTRLKMSPTAFTQHAYATSSYPERIVKSNGSVSLKKVSAATAWMKWELRHEVDGMTYAPGREPYIVEGRNRQYNSWPGWGCTPEPGDVQPFLDLVAHLFTGTEAQAQRWFLDWCAYPLQFPGVKLFTSVAMHGIRHGTGKSFIGYTLGKIYGENFTEINQTHLHSSFNEWAENKQFVLGDDVTGSDRRQDADMLKKLITQKELRVNPKYVASYVVPDCINYFFTSNHPDAFFLEDDDRRFFIHEVTVGPLPEEFYKRYDEWYRKGGAAHVFDFLLKRKLDKFNPAAPALRTSARERMIADVKSDLGAWVARLIAAPDSVLKLGDAKLTSDIYTNAELLRLYDPTGKTKTTANGLGRELRRAGVKQAYGGMPMRIGDSIDRYYIVRNVEQWTKAPRADIVTHIMQGNSPKAAKF